MILVRGIETREPVHAFLLQEIALGVFAHRRRIRRAQLRNRIDQKLERNFGSSVASELRNDRREIAAGRISANRETFRVDAKLCSRSRPPTSSPRRNHRQRRERDAQARDDSPRRRREIRSHSSGRGKDRHACPDRLIRNRRHGKTPGPKEPNCSLIPACRYARQDRRPALGYCDPRPFRSACCPCGKCSSSWPRAQPAGRSPSSWASSARPSARATPSHGSREPL